MKHIFFSFLLFFTLASPALASFTPTTIEIVDDIVNIADVTYPDCYEVYLPETIEAQNYFDGSEQCVDSSYNGQTWADVVGDADGDSFDGTYHLVLVNDAIGGNMALAACYLLTYEQCLEDASYQGVTINVVFGVVEPPAASGGFSGMLDEGETAYSNVTGESMGASVSWAGDNFIKPFIGSGLHVLFTLRHWIMALLVIYFLVFVVFSKRGMWVDRGVVVGYAFDKVDHPFKKDPVNAMKTQAERKKLLK